MLKKLYQSLLAVSALVPSTSFAQDLGVNTTSPNQSAAFIAFIFLVFFLSRSWIGIMNVSLIDHENLSSIQDRKPYLPSLFTIIGSVVCTGFLARFLIEFTGGIAPFTGEHAMQRIALFLGVGTILWSACFYKWPYRSQKYFFAFIAGTLITFALLACKNVIIGQNNQNPFIMALAVVAVIVAWRMLFGPWSTHVKVTILGTFITWIALHLLFKQPIEQRFAYALTIGIAFIPAAIWCALFLEYHKQRLCLVILMFFAGILSTAPILFYDTLVRNGIELNFFVFRIVPESFIGSSNSFANTLAGESALQAKILASLVSFILVGLIEEFSKFWVLKKGGENEFTSIDDVLQLSIIVAIGFAFAENILNPSYFLAFVNQFILGAGEPQWGSFLGNVLGRSILTNMVHIVSTGVLGYFFGLVIFARPYLEDAHLQGKKMRGLHVLQALFHTPEKFMFKREMLFIGGLIAVVLHGMFNFIVTLPELLPGKPQTLGDLLQSVDGAFAHNVALLMIPSLFYVIGGFWVLSLLFYRKESMKEHGHLQMVDTYFTTSKPA